MTSTISVPFHQTFRTPLEKQYVERVMEYGEGVEFVENCERWLEDNINCNRALLTNSCTGALDVSMQLVGLQPGDEVIMPSFNFVSAANAVVTRGATPVFVDIELDTLNIDPARLQDAVNDRTKAIIAVEYAGVQCNYGDLDSIATRSGITIIADAAQSFWSQYQGRPAGSHQRLVAFSFHKTKNVISNQGGALLINDERLINQAEMIRDNGTNQKAFHAKLVERYRWTEPGSNFQINELAAAYLLAQIECVEEITDRKRKIWNHYHLALEELELRGIIRRPRPSTDSRHNGHFYWLLLTGESDNREVIQALGELGIEARTHFESLHDSQAGKRYGKQSGALQATKFATDKLIRLPSWIGVETHIERVVDALYRVVR